MSSTTRPIVAMLVVAAAAIAFWTLILGPKRDEADKLGAQVEQLTTSVESARSELVQATAAQRSFPAAYRQLVELGQAVPASDETPSLLVELQALAASSGVSFQSIQLEGEGEASPEAVAPTTPTPPTTSGSSASLPADQVVPATEVEAALLPLGASIGTAGLAVMPYSLRFEGSFFQIADFIGKVDALVRSGTAAVKVDGRLLTINGFSLEGGGAEEGGGTAKLQASFSVTTFLTPPGQGITAGATPTAPSSEPAAQTVAAE